MTAWPSWRLIAWGAGMFAAFFACTHASGPVGGPRYIGCLGVAALAYLLALRELARTPRFPRRTLVVCLALAALWRVPFLVVPPGPEDDILRYVWDGRLQQRGYNPYTAIPADPALAKLHTAETRRMNNPDLPSPYPPGAQWFFRAVTAIADSAFAFKVAFAVLDAAIVLLLVSELGRSGRGEHWVLAYAWNPLLVTCVAYTGHIDILGALVLLLSALALRRRWRTFAAVTFGLAVAVKFLPAVLVPLYWRRVRVRDGLLAALVVASLYVPFVNHGTVPMGSLGAFVARFRFNDPIFMAVERAAPPRVAAALAVLAGLLTAAWMRRKQAAVSLELWAWPMAVSLVAAPVVYPWYLLWLVPFLGPASTLPLTVWTQSILATFYVWYAYAAGGPWQVPGRILWLEYGSVAAVAAILFVRRQRARRADFLAHGGRTVWE